MSKLGSLGVLTLGSGVILSLFIGGDDLKAQVEQMKVRCPVQAHALYIQHIASEFKLSLMSHPIRVESL